MERERFFVAPSDSENLNRAFLQDLKKINLEPYGSGIDDMFCTQGRFLQPDNNKKYFGVYNTGELSNVYKLSDQYFQALEAFKEYYKPNEFKHGEWYTLNNSAGKSVMRYSDNPFGVSLGYLVEGVPMVSPEMYREATEEEIRETLLKMAELKGFVRGVEYISPWGTTSVVRNVDFARETKKRGFRLTDNLGGGNYIYTDGIWGEVVNKNKLTLPSGRVVEFKMDGVRVGCQLFHKAEIKVLYEVIYRWSGSKITGVSILGEEVPIDVVKSAYEHFYGKLPK